MAEVLHVNGHNIHYSHEESDRSLLYDEGSSEAARMHELFKNDEFREEIEGIVQEQIEKGVLHPNLTPSSDNKTSDSPSYNKPTVRQILPVSDIRGVESLNYRKGEKVLRCKLASSYRLLDYRQDSPSACYVSDISISARNGAGQMLIAPAGILYSEVTASSLVKLDTSRPGVILDEGSSHLDPNHEESLLHTAAYNSRENIGCVVHVANQAAILVSMLKCGLLPLCYEAMVLGSEISVIEYSGSADDQNEINALKNILSHNNQVVLLRNYGVLVVGETIEETYKIAQNVMTACETQVNVISAGVDRLSLPSKETIDLACSQDKELPLGVEPSRKLNYGVIEFEGQMRRLDHEGHCTGYSYQDAVGISMQRSTSATMATPGKSSVLDDRASGIATPLSMLLMRGKRPEWVVSPNTYLKEEEDVMDSTTTGSLKKPHKKISRWVSIDENSSTNRPHIRSASLKVNANKYAPQGRNPNELREKVKEIRKEYFDDTITAGPQSTVLEGVTWEEARRIREGQMVNGVDNVRVTAASRGVIQKDHQQQALFYKKFTLNNPFENVTNEEIEKYKAEVQKKSKKSAYGKYAESEPEFLSERRYNEPVVTPVRSSTPPPKPARLSPTPNDVQGNNNKPDFNQRNNVEEIPLSSGSSKPVQTASPQQRPALTSQNQSDSNIVVDKDFPKRSQSARYPNERRPDVGRSTLHDSTGNSSTLDHRSSKENSPAKDGTLTKEKKKKKGLRLPSFSKKKEKQ